jgi:hypothetical protein
VASNPLELYEQLVATNPAVERKGATVPYTSVNGHMFSYLSKEGKLALRLPAEEREAPGPLLASTKELKKYFDASYQYVSSLKPKPTTKKKR